MRATCRVSAQPCDAAIRNSTATPCLPSWLVSRPQRCTGGSRDDSMANENSRADRARLPIKLILPKQGRGRSVQKARALLPGSASVPGEGLLCCGRHLHRLRSERSRCQPVSGGALRASMDSGRPAAALAAVVGDRASVVCVVRLDAHSVPTAASPGSRTVPGCIRHDLLNASRFGRRATQDARCWTYANKRDHYWSLSANLHIKMVSPATRSTVRNCPTREALARSNRTHDPCRWHCSTLG